METLVSVAPVAWCALPHAATLSIEKQLKIAPRRVSAEYNSRFSAPRPVR